MLITPVLKVPTNKSSIRRNKKLLYEVKLKGVFEYYWVQGVFEYCWVHLVFEYCWVHLVFEYCWVRLVFEYCWVHLVFEYCWVHLVFEYCWVHLVFEYYWVHLGNNLLYEKTHSRFGLLEKFSKSCDMFWFIAHLQWCIAFHYLFNKTGRKESISIS